MIDSNVQDYSSQNQEHADHPAADGVPDTFLAFMAKLLGAFTTVDPRVITPQERRAGRTAQGSSPGGYGY
jgi:hypothetical protein